MASRPAARDAANNSPLATIHASKDPNTARQAKIQKIADARYVIAVRIDQGQHWLAPIFKRLEAELEKLAAEEDTLARARQLVAENAAPKRAA
jgi:hypothetical protein